MKPPAALAAFAALTVALAATVTPAFAARSSYVIDDAHILSAGAIAQINTQVGALVAQTGKEVVVVSEPSLNGVAPNTAIQNSFAQLQVNGVEIYIAKTEHEIRIEGDRASAQFFPAGSFDPIAQTMRTSFRANDFDGGVENAVSVIVNTYRGHASSLNSARRPVSTSYGVQRSYSRGWSMGWIWWIVILAVIFFVIRGIFRAIAGPRMYGPGPGYGGPGYGGPGYGGPGYGGGGGGGFWSGLLGGLGGAFLGNEIFGNRGGFGGGIGGDGGTYGGGGDSNAADASGWQSDAGQGDSSNIGGASWGDSGGGDSGGGGWGGGDSGGGDSGGGGGDSGGGW
jgi:uncharacterized protein